MASLHIVDYVIFVVTIIMSFSIGVYYACRKTNDTPESYLLANRKMGIIPIATSLLVSFISAISMLGNSSEMYYYGASYLFMIIGWNLGLIVTSLTFVPLMHPLKVVSIHEYYMLRYNSKLLVYLGTFLQTTASCFINGVVIFGPAIMLQSMSDIPVWVGILVLGLISTIYTTIGGFQAVIWSDVFQAVVILAGLILINILGTVKVGGVKEVWQIYYNHGRLNLNWDPSPFVRSTVFGFALGMTLLVSTFFGVSQTAVQRFCALPTLKEAQRSVWYAIPANIIIISLTCVSGVVAFAYFAKIGCDPLGSGQIQNPNQILPFLIIEVLNYPGIPGIFVACILCGSFSNLSSSYNSISALIWDDILKDLLAERNLTERQQSVITKIIAFLAGIGATIAGFMVQLLGGTLIQISMSVGSSVFLPISIMVILGAVSTRTTWKSALVGGLVPCALVTWIIIGSNLSGHVHHRLPGVTTNCSNMSPDGNLTAVGDGVGFLFNTTTPVSMPDVEHTDSDDVFILYKMFYMWYAPFGIIIGLFIGLLLSYVPGFRNTEEVDAVLLFPFIRHLMIRTGYMKYSERDSGTYMLKEKNGVQ